MVSSSLGDVVLQQAAAPDRYIYFLLAHRDSVGPRFMQWGVFLAEDRPFARASIEAADSCGRSRPNKFTLDSHSINDVVRQAAGKIGVILELPTRQPAESAECCQPDVARLVVHGHSCDHAIYEAILGLVDLLNSSLVDEYQAVFCSRPHIVAVYSNAQNFLVRHSVCSAEILPAKHG